MRERIQNLGGELEIDSGPGRGTRLRILLPAPEVAPRPEVER
jgi:signal transduction histidine kinase